ncbi:MAG: DUF7507 domain-containing protein [Gemmatimonadaceae bacterium]
MSKLRIAVVPVLGVAMALGVLPVLPLEAQAPPRVDIAVTKTHTGNFVVGQNGTYTITVTNIGDLGTFGATTMSDVLPAGLGFVSASGTGWTCGASGQTVSCIHAGLLAPQQAATITLVVSVAAAAAPSVVNTVSVATPDELSTLRGNNTASDPTNVVAPSTLDLAITKTASSAFAVGQNASYALTVANVSQSSTSSVTTVNDVLPAGLTFVSASGAGWSCAFASGTVTCTNAGVLAPGATTAIALTVLVGPAAAPSVTNSASVSTAGDSNPANNTSTITTPVTAGLDLAITKSHAGNFTVGQNGVYTLTARNVGSMATTASISVTDNLPAGLNFVSATGAGWSCTAAGPTVTCTNPGPLAPGAASSITLTVSVGSSAPASVVNTATVSTAGDTNPTNDSASDPTTISRAPDLAIVKSASGPFTVGSNAIYTLTVANLSSGATSGPVVVTDDLPVGLSGASAAGTGWNCSVGGSAVSCTSLAPIPGNSSAAPITISAVVTLAAPTNVTNTAVVATPGDANSSNNSSTITTPVLNPFDVAIVKTASSLQARSNGTFTLTITNAGTAATSSAITVTDDLPAGLTFVDASGGGFTCGAVGQLVTCSRGASLLPGQTATITITVSVAATAGPTITNTGTVVMSGDRNLSNNSSTITVTVGGGGGLSPDLEMLKSLHGTAIVGQTGTFRLMIRNVGSGPTTDIITVTDTLDASLTYVSATGNGWTCSSSGRVVTCVSAGPMAPRDSSFIDLVANVSSRNFSNTAVVKTLGDGNARNDKHTITVSGSGVLFIDIELKMKAAAPTFAVGQATSYSLSVKNVGNRATDRPITVTDVLPAGLTPGTASGSGWTCTISGQALNCSYAAPLAPTDSTIITVNVTPTAAAIPLVTNKGKASTPGDDNPTNDESDVTTPVIGTSALALAKESVGAFRLGLQGAYRITVTSTGIVDATPPLTVRDTLPAGLTFVSATGTGWSCGAVGAVVTCTRATALAIGASSVIDLTVTLGAAALPSVTNCASVTGSGATVPSPSNRACVTTPVDGEPMLDITKTSSRSEAQVGDLVDYTVVVRNTGTADLSDALVVDDLPVSFAYEARSARLGGQSVAEPTGAPGPRLTFAIGLVRRNVPVTLTYRVRVTAVAHRGNNTNVAVAQSRDGRTQSGRGRATTRVTGGVFDERGAIVGKVYARCDCASAMQDSGEVGIPGVRVVLEDGSSAITDSEGKYNFYNVASRLHVVKVDRQTLPTGAVLAPSGNRSAFDGYTRFADVKAGELHKADFVEASQSADVLRQVMTRREAGEVDAAVMRPDSLAVPIPSDHRYRPLLVSPTLNDGNSQVPPTPPRALAAQQGRSPSRAEPPQSDVTGAAAADSQPPAPRPFLATGLFTARIDLRSLITGANALSSDADGFEESLRDWTFDEDSGKVRGGARGALLLKGRVLGNQLLTLSYDSERDRGRTFFRDIRPDEFFPVYGDAAIREFDAQSRRRVYARLDHGTSYTMFGDFQTTRADDRRILTAYDRTLNGAVQHFEGKHGAATLFASQGRSRQTVDELAGRGISGPYDLRAEGLVNSERVEIITRDRNQPTVILSRVVLTRFADYTIEPLTGRLLFRAPVPSADANLNPVSIRITYETETSAGEKFWVYGGDASVRLGDAFELGGTYAQDENPLQKARIGGINATARLGTQTYVSGELARTDDDGSNGNAWRIELRHQSAKVDGRLFAARSDSSFANQSSTFSGGRTEMGGRFSAGLGTKTRLIGEALRTENNTSFEGRRDGALLAVEAQLNRVLRVELGYRYAKESGAYTPHPGAVLSPINRALVDNDVSALRGRVTVALPEKTRSSLFAEYEKDVRDDSYRGGVGGEYVVSNRARVYGRHEWLTSLQGPYATNHDTKQEYTVVGVDADYFANTRMFNEYRLRDAMNGRDAEASIGLRNRWAVSPGLVVNTSFERVSPLFPDVGTSGASSADALAVTGAVEWTRPSLWKSTARLEFRDADTGDNFLASFGYARKLSRDWTLLGRTLWDVADLQRKQTRGWSQFGLAWRETERNKWNALLRYENRVARLGSIGTLQQTDNVAHIVAGLVNYQPIERFTLSGRYATKVATDEIGTISSRNTSQLFMGRAILDLNRRFDVGAIGSLLASNGIANRQYGLGGELGVILVKNLRIAGGYNVFGFTDKDLDSFGTTRKGAYFELGFKFDESLFGVGAR